MFHYLDFLHDAAATATEKLVLNPFTCGTVAAAAAV